MCSWLALRQRLVIGRRTTDRRGDVEIFQNQPSFAVSWLGADWKSGRSRWIHKFSQASPGNGRPVRLEPRALGARPSTSTHRDCRIGDRFPPESQSGGARFARNCFARFHQAGTARAGDDFAIEFDQLVGHHSIPDHQKITAKVAKKIPRKVFSAFLVAFLSDLCG